MIKNTLNFEKFKTWFMQNISIHDLMHTVTTDGLCTQSVENWDSIAYETYSFENKSFLLSVEVGYYKADKGQVVEYQKGFIENKAGGMRFEFTLEQTKQIINIISSKQI